MDNAGSIICRQGAFCQGNKLFCLAANCLSLSSRCANSFMLKQLFYHHTAQGISSARVTA
jgi:hypothetical protein